MGNEDKQIEFQQGVFAHPDHFYRLGLSLIASGKGDTASALARKARATCPDDPLLQAMCDKIFAHEIPKFHLAMLRDNPRNEAYRQALETVVAGKRILDIGTGSGLLAMMAARAGAAHVYACEAKPMLAATAREIVAANGLADKITVFAKHSGDLDRERDLGGGAEIVVSEIFSHTLLGEKVLPSLNHAQKALCVPGARFLPEQASIRIALADLHTPTAPITTVDGFDLSLFGRHISPTHRFNQGAPDLTLRSAPADLFQFDFARAAPQFERANVSLVSAGGQVNAIVQWIRIDFLPGIAYENAPSPSGHSHWALVATPLRRPRETRVGERINIGGWRDDTTVLAWEEQSAIPGTV